MNDLYPRPEDREAFISLLAKKKMLTSYEESLKAKDGREIFAVENVTLFEDPEGQAVIEGTLVDVTEHRMAERALMRAQDELVKAKTLQTIGMIAGGVAHEVRNPLFAINTIVTALSRKLEEQEQFKDYVSHIKDQVQRLADLMEDLLLLGRPINPSQFAPCVLSDILRQALSDLAAANPRAGEIVHLVLPGEEIAVLGVSGKLAQVFLNLIQNAVHFSLPDSVVTVSVRRDDVKVWAAVRDEGTGVPEDLLPRVFEPFQSRRKGGTGLGLAIVRKIVVEHGGIVSAQNNTPFPGATFTVRLPIMKDDCSA